MFIDKKELLCLILICFLFSFAVRPTLVNLDDFVLLSVFMVGLYDLLVIDRGMQKFCIHLEKTSVFLSPCFYLFLAILSCIDVQ